MRLRDPSVLAAAGREEESGTTIDPTICQASFATLMRIVALNIRAGGGKRVAALLGFLEQHDPDVIVLTEWRRGASGTQIEAWAIDRQLKHASLNDGGKANGVFIASRMNFEAESATPFGQASGVLSLARFQDFTILACYFPVNVGKGIFFARCGELISENMGIPFLIVGDLNTGNQIGDRAEKGVRYTSAADFDRLTTSHRLHDLWRLTNGADAKDWTWLSHRQNGFRIDHAFGNAVFVNWARPICTYDHSSRGLFTDHSATIIDCPPMLKR